MSLPPKFQGNIYWLYIAVDAALVALIALGVLRFLIFRPISRELKTVSRAYEQLRHEENRRILAEIELLKLRKAVELSGEVVFMTDKDGLFNYINPEFTRLYGYTSEEVINKNTPRILKGSQLGPESYKLFWETLASKRVVRQEFINKTKQGEFLQIESSANPILDDSGKIIGFLAIQRDITARKEIEDKLRESEVRLRRIFNTAQEGFGEIDVNGNIVSVNLKMCEIFGYGPTEMIGLNVAKDLIEPGETAKMRDHLRLRTKGTSETYDQKFRKKSGDTLWAIVSACPIFGQDGAVTGSFAIMADITDRKRLEEQILEIHENTQQQLGQELHDSLGQNLTAITYASKLLENKLAEKKLPESKEAAEIVKSVSSAIEEVRHLSRGLYPVDLGTGGFGSALEQLAAGTMNKYKIPCTVKNEIEDFHADNATIIHLYRIVQEAVLNAVKHAKARNIFIHFKRNGDELALDIKDDGAGITIPVKNTSGLGLHIMRYRAKLINADIEFLKPEEGGTLVSCRMKNSAKDIP